MKSVQVALINEIVANQIVAEKLPSGYLEFVVQYSPYTFCLHFVIENVSFWRPVDRDPFRRFYCARIVADFGLFGFGAEIVDRKKN